MMIVPQACGGLRVEFNFGYYLHFVWYMCLLVIIIIASVTMSGTKWMDRVLCKFVCH